jgi:hypothetical protein
MMLDQVEADLAPAGDALLHLLRTLPGRRRGMAAAGAVLVPTGDRVIHKDTTSLAVALMQVTLVVADR